MEIRIEGDFDAKELQEVLQTNLAAEEQLELRPVRGRAQTRFITGLEPVAILAILKGVASLTPLILAVLNHFGKKESKSTKTKSLKIIAQDDAVLVVPKDISRESLSVLLDQQPKFKNP